MQKRKSLKCRCRSDAKLFKISFVYVIFVTKALSYFRWYTLKSQSPNCSSEYFDLPIIFKNQFLLIKLYFFTIYIDGPFSRFQLENLFMLVSFVDVETTYLIMLLSVNFKKPACWHSQIGSQLLQTLKSSISLLKTKAYIHVTFVVKVHLL